MDRAVCMGMRVMRTLNSLGLIIMLLVEGFTSRWMGVLKGGLVGWMLVV